MAGKITDLGTLTVPATDDLIEVVDVSDTSMAATGTNKKIVVANLATFYGDGVRAPWADLPGGLPGRAMYWGSSGANMNLGWVASVAFMVKPGDTCVVSRVKYHVETPNASAVFHAAVYSVPSFAQDYSQTATKVTGTDAPNLDCSTGGSKSFVFGSPVTLPPGRYYLCWLWTGSALPGFYGNSVFSGWTGADVTAGNGSGTGTTTVIAIGQSSLAATIPTIGPLSGGGFIVVSLH